MRLHVVFNEQGEILAAAQINSADKIRARPIADAQKGHRAAEVFVPAEHQHHELGAIFGRLKFDTGGKFPELRLKE
jgi:hypothetical protein